MIPNIGPLEIAIVLIIALVVFGPKRLPELGKSVGRGLKEFKGSLGDGGGDSVNTTAFEAGATEEPVASPAGKSASSAEKV
ncbi:MAG: twin-arginine translocase TatA/TatE family subunit [Solirubrobacterales bacterium]